MLLNKNCNFSIIKKNFVTKSNIEEDKSRLLWFLKRSVKGNKTQPIKGLAVKLLKNWSYGNNNLLITTFYLPCSLYKWYD